MFGLVADLMAANRKLMEELQCGCAGWIRFKGTVLGDGRPICTQALAQIPKLLTLLDRNPHSPTYGCLQLLTKLLISLAHLSFWL